MVAGLVGLLCNFSLPSEPHLTRIGSTDMRRVCLHRERSGVPWTSSRQRFITHSEWGEFSA